ncbi:MAG: TlyA family RNA methyltransferase [Deltaproteobacteria bacterium]|nr:TlyA family RNA methyltransferase [Deltaproteobacteria bacterium]
MPPDPKIRLDKILADRGLAPSRERAQALVMAGLVDVNGVREDKPGKLITPDARIDVRGADHPYVSRGGVKLAGALDALGVDPAGLRCLDVGQSTGGFTDCLLQRGAAHVVGVDVGYGQLDWKLRADPRVTVIERTNARSIAPDVVGDPVDLAVIDVSFISLRLILPAVAACVKDGGRILAMVKPQFEVGRERVGAGGVVRDESARRDAIDSVRAFGRDALGFELAGEADSPIEGPSGNRETFVLFVLRASRS